MAKLPKGPGKAELQKLYGKKFRNSNLHHLVPSSRKGQTNEFNLFPYQTKSHNSYHAIFLNMTIWEVWDGAEDINRAIFYPRGEKITRDWLTVCELESEELKITQIKKEYSVEYLQTKWIKAFGGDSIEQALKTLKHMMLFIIFGSQMANSADLFDNGNLTEFFETYPANNDRLKAFNICFGPAADCHRIKSRMARILNN